MTPAFALFALCFFIGLFAWVAFGFVAFIVCVAFGAGLACGIWLALWSIETTAPLDVELWP